VQTLVFQKPSSTPTYTVYSDKSQARAFTRATGAGESDVSWNSSGGASPLSSLAIDTSSDHFYYLSVNALTRLLLLKRQTHLYRPHLGRRDSVITTVSMKEETSFSHPIYAALNM